MRRIGTPGPKEIDPMRSIGPTLSLVETLLEAAFEVSGTATLLFFAGGPFREACFFSIRFASSLASVSFAAACSSLTSSAKASAPCS